MKPLPMITTSTPGCEAGSRQTRAWSSHSASEQVKVCAQSSADILQKIKRPGGFWILVFGFSDFLIF
jgi:hypothetical protein